MASTQKRKASDYPLTPRKRITSESSSDTSTSSQSADTSESELNSDRDDHSAPASPTLTSTSLIQAPSHIISGVAATAPAIDRNNKNEKPIGHDADTKTDNDTVHIKNDDKINERGANVGEPITLEATMRVTTHAVQPAHNGTIVLPFGGDNVFPVFHSGNVIINTGLDVPKSFQLHSNVLARHSSWFRSQFSNNADQAWHSFSLENVNGSIQLVRRQTNSDDDTRRTEQDEVPDLNTNKENICEYIDSNAISVSFASGSNGEQTTMVAFYYQIFGTFYGISPVISTTDLGSALIQAEGLVKSATNLDCLGPIRPYISSSLAQYRQKLFLAIKDDPARWIKLAVSVEDTSIFTECLIHLVGAHPHWLWPTNKTSLAAEYCQLVSKKSKELDQLCVEIDRDLLMITIEVGQGRNQEPVPCHRSLMETWMLVQLFRDTVSRSLHTINKPRQRSIERGSIYRKIHKGGSAYMEYEDVHCTCQGIMQTSWRDLGEELKVLKEYASEIVRDVAENELMIDPEAHKIGYLTCAKIKPEDIPWHGSSRRST